MKTTKKFFYYAFALMGLMMMLFSSCKKDKQEVVPVLLTKEVTAITKTTAISGGVIIDDGGSNVIARGVCWGTNESPTISDSKTQNGTGIGSFTSSISGLEPNTTYYARAYATNSAGTGYGSALPFTTLDEGTNEEEEEEEEEKDVLDEDGNVYTTVIIGNQEWMVENLRTTRYNDGTEITNIVDNAEWSGFSTGAYCWFNNDTTYNVYGALYNWYTVETGKLCPQGWRVPTDEEWTQLIKYIDPDADPNGIGTQSTIAGGRLKSILMEPDDHPRWKDPNTGATDEYGFSALPGGTRLQSSGDFYHGGNNGYWWTSSEVDSKAWRRYILYDKEEVGRSDSDKGFGYSVRCIRD